MASKNYWSQETPVTWAPSGGTYTMTMTSVANGAGRIGPYWDRGTGSLPAFVKWRLRSKAAAALAVGTQLMLSWIVSDGSTGDGNIAASDAALSSIDKLRNLRPAGAINADSTTNGEIQLTSGFLFLPDRYVAPVLWNALGQALTGTAADHELIAWACGPEGQ